MNSWNPKANDVFLGAIDLSTIDERRAYVRQNCDGDDTLREEVESLLHAHEASAGLLDRPLGDPSLTMPCTPSSELPQEPVGPYRLVGVIAEGGMGVVYEAEQHEPVQRTVALKIIKPGMGSDEVISRFETERQTLAMMDHPNIARVLDAGSTETQQPYFVMELVRGAPITVHCDECHLTLRQRLKLFAQVCQAVQHAHQKGIIHRDIKPSNVLVTSQDGVAVPKVIDFGVAKALNRQLFQRSHETRFSQMVGTPLYMSPEQASRDGTDVDTRSDVYSLGVLLYELVTGTTPCRPEQLKGAGYGELQRIKCEENPQRPSLRAQELGDQLTSIASYRSVDSQKLSYQLKGELDWIIMRALDKDRQRRYQTARSFQSDVERYLKGEPVAAGPPSATYRVRKFVNRHRGLIAAAAIVLLVLVAGTVVSVWQAIRATNAEGLATRRLVVAKEALKQVDAANERSRRIRAQALTFNGGFLAAIKNYPVADRQYQTALKVDPNSPFANNNYAWFLVTCPDTSYHDPARALEMAQKAVKLVPSEGLFWNTLGVSYYRDGQWEKAIKTLEKSQTYLGDAGFGFNAMFIAMSLWQMGDQDQANCQYDVAVQWMAKNEVVNDELVRFCQEAADLLGRDTKAAAKPLGKLPVKRPTDPLLDLPVENPIDLPAEIPGDDSLEDS